MLHLKKGVYIGLTADGGLEILVKTSDAENAEIFCDLVLSKEEADALLNVLAPPVPESEPAPEPEPEPPAPEPPPVAAPAMGFLRDVKVGK